MIAETETLSQTKLEKEKLSYSWAVNWPPDTQQLWSS